MKTKKTTPGSKGLLLAAFIMLSALALKAQPICDYRIHNTLDCPVTVDVDFYQNSCSGCPGNSQSITIPANSTYTITCADITNSTLWSCGGALCDMSVKMTSPITSAACFLNSGSVPLSGLPASCNAGPGAQMDVSASDTNINR